MKKNSLFFRLGIVFITIVICSSCLTVNAASKDNAFYFGEAVTCGKDNGYIPNTTSAWNPLTLCTPIGMILGAIPDEDPHHGWELGKFYVNGFSGKYVSAQNSYNKEVTTFTKNVGDTVEFGFRLDQDINKLNGNGSLSISDDRKIVQDCWVKEPYFKANFGHGLLMVIHTDYQGNEKRVEYIDFLNGLTQGANTTIQLFEEGDYRVILCYEIYKSTGWNWITDWADPNGSFFNYRMEYFFSIRNGNCMVYPFEVETERELFNECITEKGFRVDLANSRYLKMTVKKEIMNDTGDGLVLDTRFHKDVADGTTFTDEGKYTITVTNPYTEVQTEKVIYVGKDRVMKANAVTGKSITEINTLVENGYRINKKGEIKDPIPTEVVVGGSIGGVSALGAAALVIIKRIKR